MLLSEVGSGKGLLDDGRPIAPDEERLATSEPRVEVRKVEGGLLEELEAGLGFPGSPWDSDGLGKNTVWTS